MVRESRDHGFNKAILTVVGTQVQAHANKFEFKQ